MIQLHLFLFHASLLDWEQPRDLVEAEEDLRDAVVEETGQVKFDDCSVEELQDMASWLVSDEEQSDWIDGQECWKPDVSELQEALRRRLFDHENDLREELPTAAE